MSLYPATISLLRNETTSRDSTGHPVEAEGDQFIDIPASVQHNRTTTGSNANDRTNRGFPEQPGIVRIYTPVDVSGLRKDDIIVHNNTGERFKVLRAIDQGGRGKRWRIEASIF